MQITHSLMAGIKSNTKSVSSMLDQSANVLHGAHEAARYGSHDVSSVADEVTPKLDRVINSLSTVGTKLEHAKDNPFDARAHNADALQAVKDARAAVDEIRANPEDAEVWLESAFSDVNKAANAFKALQGELHSAKLTNRGDRILENAKLTLGVGLAASLLIGMPVAAVVTVANDDDEEGTTDYSASYSSFESMRDKDVVTFGNDDGTVVAKAGAADILPDTYETQGEAVGAASAAAAKDDSDNAWLVVRFNDDERSWHAVKLDDPVHATPRWYPTVPGEADGITTSSVLIDGDGTVVGTDD